MFLPVSNEYNYNLPDLRFQKASSFLFTKEVPWLLSALSGPQRLEGALL